MKMESNNRLKEIGMKNCTCYHFDDIIKIEDFNLNNILIDEKSYENILVYSIWYKSLIDFKPLRIRFDKIYGFIWVYDGGRYLVFCRNEKYDSICNRIRYLVKSGITYLISHNYAKIKLDSYNFLTLGKTMTFYNVIILVKSVWNQDKDNYYYNIIYF